jgi:hypothetical protein
MHADRLANNHKHKVCAKPCTRCMPYGRVTSRQAVSSLGANGRASHRVHPCKRSRKDLRPVRCIHQQCGIEGPSNALTTAARSDPSITRALALALDRNISLHAMALCRTHACRPSKILLSKYSQPPPLSKNGHSACCRNSSPCLHQALRRLLVCASLLLLLLLLLRLGMRFQGQ